MLTTLQVIYIHRNVPGVLRKVNEILGDHNVDKQITDSKGDVGEPRFFGFEPTAHAFISRSRTSWPTLAASGLGI